MTGGRRIVRFLRVERRGREAYRTTHRRQVVLRDAVIAGESGGVILTVRHEPVITVGRGGSRGDILVPPRVLREKGIEVCEVERGGKVTYHGPGQVVMYPIVDLRWFTRDVHWYLDALGAVMIRALAVFGLKGAGGREAGVYTGNGKIGSIGVAVKRWVTWHGMSFNVRRDARFSLVSPCGLPPGSMTSLEEEGVTVSPEDAERVLLDAFAAEFGVGLTAAREEETGCEPR